MMFNFSIPDGFVVRSLNIDLLRCMNEHPQYFFDDFIINVAYGCPEACTWNGNRNFRSQNLLNYEIENVFKLYKVFDISYRLTFTNFLLQPEHMNDEKGNLMAGMLNNLGHGYAMVSLPVMAEHLKKYPGLKVTWSTTTDFGSNDEEIINKINELSATALTVLPFTFNHSPMLNQLTYPENIEIILQEICDGCPLHREHWKKHNEYNLGLIDQVQKCMCNGIGAMYGKKDIVGRKELADFANKGIVNFKLSGRDFFSKTLASYLYYFVRPQYTQQFIEYLNNGEKKFDLSNAELEDQFNELLKYGGNPE